MEKLQVSSALISVYDKEGIDRIAKGLVDQGVHLFSTGGTYDYISSLGIQVTKIEDLTSYPSILGGRVKTLHPKVFGGILSDRSIVHQEDMDKYFIPNFDLIIVDLYPFEETVKNTAEESAIIEKIDIGGISLIRAAAKNYKHVVVVPSKHQYPELIEKLDDGDMEFSLEERKKLAAKAFAISSHYDTAIFQYFADDISDLDTFKISHKQKQKLRYGENPHQEGYFIGDLSESFDQLQGKELSYNNIVDADAALQLMAEFENDLPTFAILKHTNACGVATDPHIFKAWHKALEADNVSAFGGVFISNTEIDASTAEAINNIFYEILLAPSFSPQALEILSSKKKRILLRYSSLGRQRWSYKSVLRGTAVQHIDSTIEARKDLRTVTTVHPEENIIRDLIFGNKCVKHLKSNAIALVRKEQLLGMGCGQTSRVDALNQAIAKARSFGFDLEGAVMASDAFFPFSDCVEIAVKAGIKGIIQPGGSIRDQDSIDACNKSGISMVTTGIRHFKH